MKLILVSKANLASVNIGKILLELIPFETTSEKFDGNEVLSYKDIMLIYANRNVIDIDYLESDLEKLNPEIIIVPSSHKSEKGVKTLTCHVPGNWSSADMGGKERVLSIAPALYLRETLLELGDQKEKLNLKDFEVSLEVTHHGPSFSLPVMFVEVGSSESEWSNIEACKAVAKSIQKVITQKLKKTKVAVGFGGGHYAPTFTRRVFNKEISFGQICPKYQIHNLDEKIVKQAFQRTSPTPDFAVIEWKGMDSIQRNKVTAILETLKIDWKKDKQV
jgi:D-aminoacyl-tRNA deacylase